MILTLIVLIEVATEQRSAMWGEGGFFAIRKFVNIGHLGIV